MGGEPRGQVSEPHPEPTGFQPRRRLLSASAKATVLLQACVFRLSQGLWHFLRCLDKTPREKFFFDNQIHGAFHWALVICQCCQEGFRAPFSWELVPLVPCTCPPALYPRSPLRWHIHGLKEQTCGLCWHPTLSPGGNMPDSPGVWGPLCDWPGRLHFWKVTHVSSQFCVNLSLLILLGSLSAPSVWPRTL